MKSYTETLYDSYGQEFRVDKLYFENKTEHQHLVIFENAKFGRVMALDGIIQTTQAVVTAACSGKFASIKQ